MDKETWKRMASSEKTDYGTPKDKFDFLNNLFHFDLDVCALPVNAKLDNYFSPEDDALSQEWKGICFMNPPYGEPENKCSSNCKKKKCIKRGWHATEYIPGLIDWMKKAAKEAEKEGTTVVTLTPARPDTKWMQVVYDKASLILFVRGRWMFEGAKDPALFPIAICVFGERPSDEIFESLSTWGNVVDPANGGIVTYEPSSGRR